MKAAIDCGTNSFRLLIADDDLQPIRQELRITRLGEGVHETGAISGQAMQRAIDALAEFHLILEKYDVTYARATTTSAARDASNGKAFLALGSAELGVDIELISGEEEGRLTYRGVAQGIDASGPLLVIDIGGGSTEFSFGIDGELQWAHSLQLGSVRLTELELHGDPYSAAELERAQQRVDATLSEVDLSPVPADAKFVGVAGTVTSIAMIAKGISTYETDVCHGLELTAGEVHDVTHLVGRLTNDERLALPGLPPGRADVITAGATILDRSINKIGSALCTVSESDLLFGMLE